MADDPSRLSFTLGQVGFSGDPTLIRVVEGTFLRGKIKADKQVRVDEVFSWRIHAERIVYANTNTTKECKLTWNAYLGEEENINNQVAFTANGKSGVFLEGSEEISASFEEISASLRVFCTNTISPKIAQRIVNDVLEGKTVKIKTRPRVGLTGRPLSISKDGLTQQEGTFKKRDVIYPWSAYQGCPDYDEIHLGSGEKIVKIELPSNLNGGVAPMALDALAKHLSS